jgi:SAM-dependent methyltransferase
MVIHYFRTSIFSIIFILSICLFSCHPAKRNQQSKNNTENISSSPVDLDTLGAEVEFQNFDSLVRIYEDPERENWQSPDLILEKMGNLKGKIVADIGVGTGYFAFRLINHGASVIGIDIDKRFLDYIEDRKAELSPQIASKLVTRLSLPESPSLNSNEVNWVLIVNTYHFLDNRVAYLKKLITALKPSGKIIIVDFRKGYSPVGPAETEKVPTEVITTEVTDAGFKISEIDEQSLQYQYILIASKP